MKKPMVFLAVASALMACDGNPFVDDDTSGGDTEEVGGVTLPTGGSTNGGIRRYETDGEADSITYDELSDTISINNLPFDGDGTFDRDDVLPTLIASPHAFQVYENNNTTERRAYKTIYAESASGDTNLAITRTGSYVGYGFGGFVYAREGGVNLPSTGQATYDGNYAGMRVFDGQGGLEFTTADAQLIVDFEDFDATDAVEGAIYNRQYFDQNGNLLGSLPTLILATGSISSKGEIGGTLASEVAAGTGVETFESGEYYAIIAGNPADEIVGIIVVTGDDPNDVLDGGAGITVQETGGFIVTSP